MRDRYGNKFTPYTKGEGGYRQRPDQGFVAFAYAAAIAGIALMVFCLVRGI